MYRLVARAAFLSSLLTAALAAQPTTQSVFIGGSGALGCQGTGGTSPLLTGGTAATAQLDFTYDSATQLLTLDVSNTSPITAGVANPLITGVAFALPLGTLNAVTLVSQTGAGGVAPAFRLRFDPDVTLDPWINFGCFGRFGVLLENTTGSLAGSIANAGASTFAVPASSLVTGPVRFVLRLSGPAAPFLTSRILALAFSMRGQPSVANAALEFEGGGPTAQEVGIVANGEPSASCQPNIWITAPARIGTTIQLCISGTTNCYGCLAASLSPGPTVVGPLSIPLGLPLALAAPFPYLPGANTLCFPFDIPLEQSLVGTTFYTVQAATLPDPSSRRTGGAQALLEITPRFDVTFTDR
ncbi:MAG: hypothetical protein AAF628_29040 [Planctomycetota bacterium]